MALQIGTAVLVLLLLFVVWRHERALRAALSIVTAQRERIENLEIRLEILREEHDNPPDRPDGLSFSSF